MRKAQAAISDALLFLVVVMLALGLVFHFVSNYGNAQDATLRSAYTIDFVQALIKALYYMDVGTLASTDAACAALADYSRSGDVALCLKEDAADCTTTSPCAIDNVGAGCGAVGLKAMRCALNESFKPFRYAGYHYLFEMRDQNDNIIPVSGNAISSITKSGNEGCDSINALDKLAVSAPFRVVMKSVTTAPTSLSNWKITVCLWR